MTARTPQHQTKRRNSRHRKRIQFVMCGGSCRGSFYSKK